MLKVNNKIIYKEYTIFDGFTVTLDIYKDITSNKRRTRYIVIQHIPDEFVVNEISLDKVIKLLQDKIYIRNCFYGDNVYFIKDGNIVKNQVSTVSAENSEYINKLLPAEKQTLEVEYGEFDDIIKRYHRIWNGFYFGNIVTFPFKLFALSHMLFKDNDDVGYRTGIGIFLYSVLIYFGLFQLIKMLINLI